MTESAPPRRHWLAWAWALLVLGCALHLALVGSRGEWPVDTDVMALLPQDTRHPAAEQALTRLSDAASRRVVVVLAADDFARVRAAASDIQAQLAGSDSPLQPAAGNLCFELYIYQAHFARKLNIFVYHHILVQNKKHDDQANQYYNAIG